MQRLRLRITDTGGAEIAEAAVVLPLVFLFLIGIYWFGRAFNIYSTIDTAAREGARVGVAQTCATCTPPNTLATTTAIGNEVQSVLQASRLDPTQMILPTVAAPNACGTVTALTCQMPTSPSLNMCVYYNAQLDSPSATPAACGVVVAFKYPYQFYFPFTTLNFQLVQLPANVQMKGEY
jgi:hypothetical protein